MNRQELEAQAAKLQAELDAMKSKIAQMDQPKGRWVPELNEKYYYFYSGGAIDWAYNSDDNYDKGRFSIGNCFRTREEAERHVEKLKVIEEMKALAGYWEPDWNNDDQVKWHIAYNNILNRFETYWGSHLTTVGVIYFKSREDAQKAINVLGDKLKVLL